jgi:hypothetical protein
VIRLRSFFWSLLSAIAAIGVSVIVAFTPVFAAAVDPARLSADEITAVEHCLTDAACYNGAIDGQKSAALNAAIKACPDQHPFLRIETGMHTDWIMESAQMRATAYSRRSLR